MMKFEFGQTVSDEVTGFQGVITGFTTYITGCNQYLLQPKVKGEDKDWVDSRWIDEERLILEGTKQFKLKPKVLADNRPISGPDKPAPKR